jgi:PAS domain S-box-containing protein
MNLLAKSKESLIEELLDARTRIAEMESRLEQLGQGRASLKGDFRSSDESVCADFPRSAGIVETLRQEVGAQKRIENESVTRDRLYRTLVETANDIIWTVDLDLRFTYVSPSVTRVLGYSVDEIMSMRPLDTLTPESQEIALRALREELEKAATGPKDSYVSRTEEMESYRKDGSTIWIQISAAFLKDDDGKPIGILGISRDITERKIMEQELVKARDKLEISVQERTAELARANESLRAEIADRNLAEEALWESEAYLRALMAIIPDPLVVYDPQGAVTYINPAFENIYGWSLDELLNKRIDFVPPEEAEKTREAWARTLRQERVLWATRRYTKDGKIIDIELASAVLLDRDGKHRASIVVHRDITERKRVERALRKANAELESFSYSVSHDLRAPLRGIDGWSLALLEDYGDSLDTRAKEYLEFVRAETQRMGKLIDDLLELSRVTRSKMSSQQVNLSELVRCVTDRLRLAEPHRKVEFVIHPQSYAYGDPRLLEIMLENLLGNAWKFTVQRPLARIEFGRTVKDGEIVYFVSDNGAGFDMAYARKLFGAFQRMHRASEFPGSGVGLATVQRIIHRHGGRVWAEAEVEKGATFYFTL